jgi:sec-independent protein translocase protein TatA
MLEGLFQPTHLILVLAIVLIVFGPGKLPEAGKALGHAIRDFKKALNEANTDPKLSAAPKDAAEGEAKSRSA